MLLYVFEGWNRNKVARVEIDKITRSGGDLLLQPPLHSRQAIATPALCAHCPATDVLLEIGPEDCGHAKHLAGTRN
jgi:hypothetical protein